MAIPLRRRTQSVLSLPLPLKALQLSREMPEVIRVACVAYRSQASQPEVTSVDVAEAG
jgi:hypothetical protein